MGCLAVPLQVLQGFLFAQRRALWLVRTKHSLAVLSWSFSARRRQFQRPRFPFHLFLGRRSQHLLLQTVAAKARSIARAETKRQPVAAALPLSLHTTLWNMTASIARAEFRT